MAKKILTASAIVVAVIVIGLVISTMLVMKGPDLSQYEHLKNPQMSLKAGQRMLVVEAQGDPNTTGVKAFGLLFHAYYKNVKARGMIAPRARWPKPFDTPVNEWVGLYALPLPQTAEIKDLSQSPGYTVSVQTWEYGDVAEILHVGPYSTETPTIDRLKKFITDQGCQIAGPHEEEYLRGPGMFGKGNPDKYYTIIRYQVKKAEPKIELKKGK